ncbi:MAG: VOC family protein [Rhizobiales bacterium]|nr:VOC family protein [Hyphomicrobiales bacterium]
MTQIRGYVGPTRRPGELGIHSLDHFNLVVPDLKVAETFYTSFGLDMRAFGNSLGFHTDGHAHRWGTVTEGDRKQLSHLSFGCFDDDLPRFRDRLQELGIAQLDPPPGFESNGLWFRDPDGSLVEIRVAEKSSPNEKSISNNASGPAGTQTSPNRSAAPAVRPRRLAHILIFTADVARAIAFYSRVLGLRLSDRSGDGIAFMHGIHGSDHHLIALAKSEGPGLHHLSWDVGSIHEIGLGAMQMADKGFSAGWGLGRHVLGSNFFHYVRDPWGSYSEYSSDIDYIPSNFDWEAGDHPGHDAFYVWGPTPPDDFAFNYEAAKS